MASFYDLALAWPAGVLTVAIYIMLPITWLVAFADDKYSISFGRLGLTLLADVLDAIATYY